MDTSRDRGLVADHLVEALWACAPGATDVELADYILRRFSHVPIEDADARKYALDALADRVRMKREEVQNQARALHEQ